MQIHTVNRTLKARLSCTVAKVVLKAADTAQSVSDKLRSTAYRVASNAANKV